MSDEVEVVEGAFFDALTRSGSKIRKARAASIGEDAQLTYKRTIENLELSIKRMRRDQEDMLDMSPDNVTSLIVATDFSAEGYVDKDIELGVKIRNAGIKLKIAQERYSYLFGGD